MKKKYIKAEIGLVKLGDELLAPIIVNSQETIDPGMSHAPRYYNSYFLGGKNDMENSYLSSKDLWEDEEE